MRKRNEAIEDLAALIEKLSGLMEQETALVRAGRMKSATPKSSRENRSLRAGSSCMPANG